MITDRLEILFIEPGDHTGDSRVHYNDGTSEYLVCGQTPTKAIDIPIDIKVYHREEPPKTAPPSLGPLNRAMRRAQKFGRK